MFSVGKEIFLVTQTAQVLTGFKVKDSLFGMVVLYPNPLDTPNHGFTIRNNRLIPNWCAGKKTFLSGYTDFEEAQKAAIKQEQRLAMREDRCRK